MCSTTILRRFACFNGRMQERTGVSRAVEPNVDVAVPGNLEGRNAWNCAESPSHQFRRDLLGGFLQLPS